MDVPDDIPAGAGMHGATARRVRHTDAPAAFPHGEKFVILMG